MFTRLLEQSRKLLRPLAPIVSSRHLMKSVLEGAHRWRAVTATHEQKAQRDSQAQLLPDHGQMINSKREAAASLFITESD
jgi:hypothetical protein